MKFLHLGDLHIGKSLGEFHLIEDQIYILDQILTMIEKKSVDAVLIAGDVYDKSIPSEEAVRLFDTFICKLAERNIKTFIISGNHDSDERLNFGSSLFEAKQIYISAKYKGVLYKQELMDEYGKVNVYLLPFVKASQVRHFFPDKEIDSYDKAVKVIIEHAQINTEERNILVAHQFVAGNGKSSESENRPVLGGSENFIVQNVGLVEQIGTDCFDAFDYVALGHIHSPQKIGREEIRYSGSLLKYSFSEVDNEKSVPIITLSEKGLVTIELEPLKPLRDMRHLKGTLKQLLNKENITAPNDFIYATLTDEDPINDAMNVFQQYYPNTVKIDYDNAHTKAMGEMDLSKTMEKKSFDDLISDFYQFVYGCEMGEEEMEIMKSVAREAGVLYEAD